MNWFDFLVGYTIPVSADNLDWFGFEFLIALDFILLSQCFESVLQVYVTMYPNDCQHTAFYEGIGLNTKEFDMHVIIETNRTTTRIFLAILDVEKPKFKRKLDRMVEINEKLIAVGET